MPNTELIACIHPVLVDQLDEHFSPMDGLVAINQIYLELPQLHPAAASELGRKRPSRTLKVYRGRYDWFDLGFSYVQLGRELHVLELWNDTDWNDPHRLEVDVVLGRGPVEVYAPTEVSA